MMQLREELYVTPEPSTKRNRLALEKAIDYLDSRIIEEPDDRRVVEFCAMKIDLINELMQLGNKELLIIYQF